MDSKRLWTMPGLNVLALIVPKCGCSTIGEVIHYLGKGEFIGDHRRVHHGEGDFIRSMTLPEGFPNKDMIAIQSVRNPFSRILSAYLDKMVSVIEPPRSRYRDYIYNAYQGLFSFGNPYEDRQVEEFERFIEFLAGVYLDGKYEDARDPHFGPYSPLIRKFNDMMPDKSRVITLKTETLSTDLMEQVVRPLGGDLKEIPRFNENRVKPFFPKKEFFSDPATVSRIQDIFQDDFRIGGYSPSPRDL